MHRTNSKAPHLEAADRARRFLGTMPKFDTVFLEFVLVPAEERKGARLR
jgi:hypothetical protein